MTYALDPEQKTLEENYLLPTFGRYPVEFVRGEGARLYDTEGNEFLDFLAGIAVCSLGHCNKNVVKAIQDQAAQLMHVSNYFYIQNRGEAAKKINDLLNFCSEDPQNWKMFFTNSGAESNECAIKITRFAGNRSNGNDGTHTKVIVLKQSFHGRTMETLAATAQDRFHYGLFPLSPVFIEVEANNEEELENTFRVWGDQVAAMVLEPVQGESGVHPITESYMKLVRKLTEENNAFMIVDEVQTGIYRSGAPFAFQLSGVVPDMVTMAKGIGGGFPCGCCAARGRAAEILGPGDHGTTFGGSCLAIAAINATLDELKDEDVLSNVVLVSDYMRHKLETVEGIKEVRGRGLLLGADLDDGISAHDVVAEALTGQNLIINATVGDSTLRFLPPLIISKADVDEFIVKLEAAIKTVEKAA